MNKYQEFYLNHIVRFNVISYRADYVSNGNQVNSKNNKKEKERDKGTNGCTFKDGVYTIYQNDNYYLKKYLVALCSAVNCKVYLNVNGEKIRVKQHDKYKEEYHFMLDFDNRADSIIVEFDTKLIDPIEIPIVYIESDKEARDKKLEEERIENENKTVDINVIPGASFVNIVFKQINNSYNHAEADLYFINQKKPNSNGNYFLATYKGNKKAFFINVPNLSYGCYELVLRQYDINNKIIYTSPRTRFNFEDKEEAKNFNGPNIVTWY